MLSKNCMIHSIFHICYFNWGGFCCFCNCWGLCFLLAWNKMKTRPKWPFLLQVCKDLKYRYIPELKPHSFKNWRCAVTTSATVVLHEWPNSFSWVSEPVFGENSSDRLTENVYCHYVIVAVTLSKDSFTISSSQEYFGKLNSVFLHFLCIDNIILKCIWDKKILEMWT